MKKLVAVVLALVLVLSVQVAAWLSRSISSPTVQASSRLVLLNLQGRATLGTSLTICLPSNVAPDHRAVARVHKGVDAASATWVYDGVSSSPHPYYSNAVVGQVTLDFRGRLDNTASGLLEFHGNFQN